MTIQLLKDWQFWTFSLAFCSLLFSLFNFIIGKIVTTKITQNDLKHLNKDVEKLQKQDTNFKEQIEKKLSKIFRRLGKIEKIQYAQTKICNERHKKDK